jgi:hypothetical protein
MEYGAVCFQQRGSISAVIGGVLVQLAMKKKDHFYYKTMYKIGYGGK